MKRIYLSLVLFSIAETGISENPNPTLRCTGTFEVSEISNVHRTFESVPTRALQPRMMRITTADGLAVSKTASADCTELSQKYGMNFTVGAANPVAIKLYGWEEPSKALSGKTTAFTINHYVNYIATNGHMPLMPTFSHESFYLSTDQTGITFPNPIRTADTTALYGSLPTKTFGDKVAALAAFDELLSKNSAWRTEPLLTPFIQALVQLKPDNVYNPEIEYGSKQMRRALGHYLKTAEEVLTAALEAQALPEATSSTSLLLQTVGKMLVFETGSWGGSSVKDLKIQTILAFPQLLYVPAMGQSLVFLTSSLNDDEWDQFLNQAQTSLPAEQGDLYRSILQSLLHTHSIGIQSKVYERISSLLSPN